MKNARYFLARVRKFRSGKLILAALAVLLIATTTNAQRILTAEIPFDFQVGKNHLMAGRYTVDLTSGGSVILQPTSGGRTLTLSNSAGPNTGETPESCLVFQRHGDQMYLREVWSALKDEGRRFPLPKTKSAVVRSQGEKVSIVIASAY